MAQYIDKADVVAEIKKIYNEDYKFLPSDLVEGVQDFKDDLLIKLDTLEVKDAEEELISNDLEEAATKYARKQVENPDYPTYNDEYELECAFEAGAQWQKEQMIDKACEFLKSYRQDTPDGIGYIAGIVDDKTIEEFKQAMEE